MLYCKECGAALPDETPRFCPLCGAILGATARAPENAAPARPLPLRRVSVPRRGAPAELRPSQIRGKYPPPLSTASLIWSILLLLLPGAGLIAAVVWASGGAVNENRRNLGRAALLLRLVALAGWLAFYFASRLMFRWMDGLPFGY